MRRERKFLLGTKLLSGLMILTLEVLGLHASAQTNFAKAITAKTSITLHGCMAVDSFNSQGPHMGDPNGWPLVGIRPVSTASTTFAGAARIAGDHQFGAHSNFMLASVVHSRPFRN